ncbi:transmembrane protein 202-like isoform X1 [Myotis daubentonii]|uniref:transmembrane protein 202-like isoform X1 n=1 Tax=Myotis daubentonii TaxID=98922 RepID=UPI002873F39A|nr:transmembrane protein 202-like isoform X1 [Myotis daubentonii]
MDASCTVDLSDPNYSWEEDRKYILRGWALVFSTLTTLMVLSAVDGRMAYLEGSYSGYMGFWINCKKYKCSNVGQVTVLIHMSMGLMMLALTICLILVTTMALSFWPVFRRLNKTDLIFSLLSFGIGFLVILSMTLFVANCQALRPKPRISYLFTSYLCWGSGALILWTGVLSYLNYAGMWSQASFSWDRRVSYWRWASRLTSMRHLSRQSDSDRKSSSLPGQGIPAKPP